ncbi:hypothetical protein EJ08DRAFT_649861 [Tothia fuscella]|uniref:Uncharacterized protein n=1 Tax=Tothia fuscella TaxID=1048955 RepID=A0A9P4TYX9_9PEZI|nr:hypothetical protein EJ08DRAFT_649861 [Tothia fuscella]
MSALQLLGYLFSLFWLQLNFLSHLKYVTSIPVSAFCGSSLSNSTFALSHGIVLSGVQVYSFVFLLYLFYSYKILRFQ